MNYNNNAKKNILSKIILILLTISIVSCSKTPNLNYLDSARWKQDKTGKDGYRKNVAKKIILDEKNIIGVHESEIYKILGKPNKFDMSDRMHKTAIYQLNETQNDTLETLHLEFESLGRLKFITLQKELNNKN